MREKWHQLGRAILALYGVMDAAELLRGSTAWTTADRAALQHWMRGYLEWLRSSSAGQQDRMARDHRGSWFAAQTAAYAYFAGDSALMRKIAADARARIGWQLAASGEQSLELGSARVLHASAFNIDALSRLAEVGRRVGVDLWAYEAPSGGSIRGGLDHLVQRAQRVEQVGACIEAMEVELMALTLRRASLTLGGADRSAGVSAVRAARDDRSVLLYPAS